MNYPGIRAVRNDELSMEQARELVPSCIIFSPGPGYPGDAGVCVEAARELGQMIPLPGVCLGHQAICEAYGATVSYARQPIRSEQSVVTLDTDCPLFSRLPKQIKAACYHSFTTIHDTMPECLVVTVETDDGEVMVATRREFPIYRMQFHPESILTESGMQIIQNFLTLWKEHLS